MPDEVASYLATMGRERYRAVIFHSVPAQAQALSQFTQRVAECLNGTYIDLLSHFLAHTELAANLDTFGPNELCTLLVELAVERRLLVVDKVDFLLDTWSKPELQAFYRLIRLQWDSFTPTMSAILILCLQRTTELESLDIMDSHKHSRARRLEDFQALV